MSKSYYIILLALILKSGTALCQYTTRANYDSKNLVEIEFVEGEDTSLPTYGELESYEPSGNKYYPIKARYSSRFPAKYIETTARIVPYLYGFKPDYSAQSYKNSTNCYGSSTTLARQKATGRFYTKKINGRWWIVDPEGYLHHNRSFTTVNNGSKYAQGPEIWANKFSSINDWLAQTRDQMHELGVHGTAAFASGQYMNYLKFNKTTDKPLIVAPSFAFLSHFRSSDKIANEYPDKNPQNRAALALYDGWDEFCKKHVAKTLAPYKGDPNVLGFFSDNEINFSSFNKPLLKNYLRIKDQTNIAYTSAKKFMEDHGVEALASNVTKELNNEFAGIVAQAYYKGVREALDAFDPEMLYLGTRLHGTPKYMESVIKAAGKYCDIISINFYNRWNPDYLDIWPEWTDSPIIISEFYTKGETGYIIPEADSLYNKAGTGYTVPTQKDRGYAYHNFTLGLLESKNCVGWHWFRYIDSELTNNGVYNYKFEQYEELADYMRRLNYNVYNLIEYFDN